MKIGILGLGSIGSRHAKNLMMLGHDVVAYDPEMAPLPGRDKVLEQAEAIFICTPTYRHIEDYMDTPDVPVFIEKPLSDKRMDFIYDTKPIMMGNNLRFHPAVKFAKECILEGKIGIPQWASFICAQENNKYDDGVISNWGGHEIDLSLHLLGPAEVEASVARPKGKENIADIILNQNGCQTNIHLDYLSKQWIRTFTIMGTDGCIACDLDGRRAVWSNGSGEETEDHVFKGSYDLDYIVELHAFFNMIAGLKTDAASGKDGIETLKIILEARRIAGTDE